MITAVLFDLFETLVTEFGMRPARASSLASALGLETAAYRQAWKARRGFVVRGDMTFAEALTEISRELIGKVDQASVQRLCRERAREKAAVYAQIHPEIAALVTGLRRRSIALAVISNAFTEDVVAWPACSLAPDFRCAMFSCAERIAKPDREIYHRAIRRLDADPATAVYIGDGGDDELAGAEHAGLRAYRAAWFVRNRQQSAAWPELVDQQEVLELVGVG